MYYKIKPIHPNKNDHFNQSFNDHQLYVKGNGKYSIPFEMTSLLENNRNAHLLSVSGTRMR